MGKKAQSKQTPTIHLRRAKAEDVVNIFKLVRRQQGGASLPTQENSHWVIGYLLDQIINGYVVVADLSGRLVGVLGCKVLPEQDGRATFGLDTFAFAPEFGDTGVEQALLKNLCAFMKKQNHILKIVVKNDELDRQKLPLVREAGFNPVAVVYELGAEREVIVDAEPESNVLESEDGADAPSDEPEWTEEASDPEDS